MCAQQRMTLRQWCESNNRLELIDQWDQEENDKHGISLDILIPFTTVAYWRCPKQNHPYDMAINLRTNQKQNCPICRGLRVFPGFNDLASKCPSSVDEWDYNDNWSSKENRKMLPSDYTYGSHDTVSFICPICHKPYPIMVKTYYRRKNNNRRCICKYCSRNEVLPDKSNSFANEHPELLQYWDSEKNSKIQTKKHPNGVNPDEILSGSNIRLFWKCNYGHYWPNTVVSQLKQDGCSKCNRRRGFSDSEKAVAYYIEKMFPGDIEDNYHPEWNKKQDLDIYIPSASIAIQYDGSYRHNQSKYMTDLRNGNQVMSHGIKLIRIRENDSPSIPDGSLEIRRNGTGIEDIESLNECIEDLLQKLSELTKHAVDFTVDCRRDYSAIVDRSYAIELGNSISKKRPDLVQYISNNHNQDREILSRLPYAHNGKIWWICPKCDLEHEIVVSSVTHKPVEKFPCKVKASKEVVRGMNDFESKHPELMKDWDWINNSAHGNDPKKLTKGSDKGPFYWICHKPDCKHPWQTNTLAERTRKNATGCPKCYEKKRKDRTKNKGAKYTIQYLLAIRDNPGITAREIQTKTGSTIAAVKSKLGHMVEIDEIRKEKVRKTKTGPESYAYYITDSGLSIISRLSKTELAELSKSDISRKAPKQGVDDLVTWCKIHDRTRILEEWSPDNNDRAEDHRAGDDDEKIWKCLVCDNIWPSPIFMRTLRGYDCGECYQRTKRLIELQCLTIIRDNPGIAGETIAEELGRNLYFILNKLKQMLNKNELIRAKQSRKYVYSITEKGLKEINLFSKIGMKVGPFTIKNK